MTVMNPPLGPEFIESANHDVSHLIEHYRTIAYQGCGGGGVGENDRLGRQWRFDGFGKERT